MPRDWVGNKAATFVTLAASNHTERERESNDFYATEPKAMELLCDEMKFHDNIWECAVGQGHLAKTLTDRGYNVKCSDICDRGYPGTEIIDFLTYNGKFDGDIITNPPYKFAQEFVEKALDCVNDGKYVIMFLKVQFLEGKKRKMLYENNPPKYVYVSSSRLNCAVNGEFDRFSSSAVAYAWFVWEKGYRGDTIVKWFN